MEDLEYVARIPFVKNGHLGILKCEMLIYQDGSAYVIGDDIEIICDDSPDAVAHGLQQVLAQGYVVSVPNR